MTIVHMWDRPYIKKVLAELERRGYSDSKAVLFRYYKGMRRTVGFYLNAEDFAQEIDMLDIAVRRSYELNGPEQVYIGHLRKRLNKKK